MEKGRVLLSPEDQERPEFAFSNGKKPWQEPKLVFVEPKLIKHGELVQLTGVSFFGEFEP
jgi:hypothetical protein